MVAGGGLVLQAQLRIPEDVRTSHSHGLHALEEPQELVRAKAEPINTPTAFRRIARLEGCEEIVDQAQARIRGRDQALGPAVQLRAQHVLGNGPVCGRRRPVVSDMVVSDPLEPPDLSPLVDMTITASSPALPFRHANPPMQIVPLL